MTDTNQAKLLRAIEATRSQRARLAAADERAVARLKGLVVRAHDAGMIVDTIVNAAGVSRTTVYEWLAQARKEKNK